MNGPLETPRCQFCTRDAVFILRGRFSGEPRAFTVCAGCADELQRIRRRWHVRPADAQTQDAKLA